MRRGERHCDSVTTAVSTPTAKKRWDDAERELAAGLRITERLWRRRERTREERFGSKFNPNVAHQRCCRSGAVFESKTV